MYARNRKCGKSVKLYAEQLRRADEKDRQREQQLEGLVFR
jgi:hypothetical protein